MTPEYTILQHLSTFINPNPMTLGNQYLSTFINPNPITLGDHHLSTTTSFTRYNKTISVAPD